MTADQHRRTAQRSVRLADESTYAEAAGQHRFTALTYTMLAIEAHLGEISTRLGELVEAQHTATLLAGQAYGMADKGAVRRLVDAVAQARMTSADDKGGE